MKTLVSALLICSASAAAADCYHKPMDPSETIRETAAGLLWEHRDQRVEFETGSAGTGIETRVAFDARGNGFPYFYRNGDLVFGDVLYAAGCPEEDERDDQ